MRNKPQKLPTFFANDVASVLEGTKGRSRRLITRRNEALCDRFYFYQKIHHYHFAKCVEELSNEFYLSQIETVKIIRRMGDYLSSIKATPPSLRDLRAKYSHLNWG